MNNAFSFSLLALLFMPVPVGCGDDGSGVDGSTSRDGATTGDTSISGDSAAPRDSATTGDACVPTIEICGDRIDQNCDGRDQGCGNSDMDPYPACGAGDDLTTCDCDDDIANVYPGAPELCDGRDNDCNGRVDEVSECCAGCMGLDPTRADICDEAGACDCSTEAGTGPCAEGQTCCADGCTDIGTDTDHCGACNRGCTDQADRCTAGDCRCGTNPACDFINMCVSGACS